MYKQQQHDILQRTETYSAQIVPLLQQLFDEIECQRQLSLISVSIDEFFKNYLVELKEHMERSKTEIQSMRQQINRMKGMLTLRCSEEQDLEEPALPLRVQLVQLEAECKQLQQQIEEHKQLLAIAVQQEQELCMELGQVPKSLNLADVENPVLELQQAQGRLLMLQQKRAQRLVECDEMCRSIEENLRLLNQNANSELEKLLQPADPTILNHERYRKLKQEQYAYQQQLKYWQSKFESTWTELHKLWNRLNINAETRNKFSQTKYYNKESYKNLLQELSRCKKLREHHMAEHIQQLRQQLQHWWDKTLKSQAQREQFADFHNDNYSEDLLQLHELELEEVKSYYEQYRQIFELYAEHQQLWESMLTLEAKAKDPERYKNRGGQLLVEEKERKFICSKLPKIERNIEELAQCYERKQQQAFLVKGVNILEQMKQQRERQREQQQHKKELKKALFSPAVNRQTPAVNKKPNGNAGNSPRVPVTPRLDAQPRNNAMTPITVGIKRAQQQLKLVGGKRKELVETPSSTSPLKALENINDKHDFPKLESFDKDMCNFELHWSLPVPPTKSTNGQEENNSTSSSMEYLTMTDSTNGPSTTLTESLANSSSGVGLSSSDEHISISSSSDM